MHWALGERPTGWRAPRRATDPLCVWVTEGFMDMGAFEWDLEKEENHVKQCLPESFELCLLSAFVTVVYALCPVHSYRR